ncbi:MAG: UDP-glucose 4-epimerase GalE [Flavobacteriia bacterium]|nr:UDP-glucose 4-epimerase GalE [Flavobacteriia bacterium]
MENKKILITGGAGYIGSHTITEIFEKTNHQLVSVDNFSNSSPITYQRIEKITGKTIPHYNVDLCDFNSLEQVFEKEKFDGIIHFAAYKSVPESVENPHKYYHNNLNSLLNVLELALKYQTKHFLFSSSCSVYGNIKEMPVSEETPLNKAVSPYAYTKQIGEQMLADYANIYPDLQILALRYFNPVGAHPSALIGEDPINTPTALVPIITKVASGKMKELSVYGTDYNTRDGSCIRDYIHVCDLANAHLVGLQYLFDKKNQHNFDIINIGSGNGISVLEAIKSFEKVAGITLPIKYSDRRAGDVESIYSNTKKSEKVLNWKAEKNIDEMMKSAWEWEKGNL